MNNIIGRLIRNQKRLLKFNQSLYYPFSNFGMKKQIDFSKESIKLLIEPMKYDISLDILLQTRQLNATQAIKMFFAREATFSIGQHATLCVRSNFQIFQEKVGFRKLSKTLESAIDASNDNPQTLHLDNDVNLTNYFTLIEYLQSQYTPQFLRVNLLILANYLENYSQIKENHYLKIVLFLTERMYVTESMRKKINNLNIDNLILEVSKDVDGAHEVANNFQKLSHILQIMINLKQIDTKSMQNKSALVKQNKQQKSRLQQIQKRIEVGQRKIDQLSELYFQMMRDNNKLGIILSSQRTRDILIDSLFRGDESRSQYLAIFKSLFQSQILYSAKVSSDFIPVLFDKLFLFSTPENRQQIIDILDSFIICFRNLDSDGNNIISPQTSLLLLHKKYNHFTELFMVLVNNQYMKVAPQIKDAQPTIAVRRSRYNAKNQKMFYCTELGYFLDFVSNYQFTRLDPLKETYIRKIEYIFDLGKVGELFYFGNDLLANQIDQNIYTKRIKYAQQSQYYDLADIHQYTRPLLGKAVEVENKLNVTLIQQGLQDHCTPINCKSTPAITKAIFDNASLFSHLTKDTRKLQKLIRAIVDNQQINKLIVTYIAYPGLLESAFMFYQTVKNHPKIANILSNSRLQKFVTQNRVNFSKIYQNIIEQYKNIEDKIENIPYLTHQLAMLYKPYKKNIQVYKQQSSLLDLFRLDFVNTRLNKPKNLRMKMGQYLREYVTNDSQGQVVAFSYFVDYPFIADFMIFYRNAKFAVLFADPLSHSGEMKISEFQQKQKFNLNGVSIEQVQPSPKQIAQYKSSQISQNMFTKYFERNNAYVIVIKSEEQIKNLRYLMDKVIKQKLTN